MTCGSQVHLASIEEVYARFAHMDTLLGDVSAEPEDPIGKTCWALWAAVKCAMRKEKPDA